MTTCYDTRLTPHGVRGRRPTDEGRARTAKARDAWLARIEAEVDPHRRLAPDERRRRAVERRREWMRQLALRSTQVRQANRRAAIAMRSLVETLRPAHQAGCQHSWPDALTPDTECLDCGLDYRSWDDQLGADS